MRINWLTKGNPLTYIATPTLEYTQTQQALPFLEEVQCFVVRAMPWHHEPAHTHQCPTLVEELLQLFMTGCEHTDDKTKLTGEGVPHCHDLE